MLVDAHCHLDSTFDLEVVIGRAKSEGVNKIITVGTSIESSKKCLEIADSTSLSTQLKLQGSRKLQGAKENIPKIYATVGIHPRDGKGDVEEFGLYQCINTLKQLIESSDKVVGIGETGLDYYLAGDKRQATSNKEKEIQRELLSAQIQLAVDLDLPLVVHCRNGWEEIFDSISKIQTPNSKLKGVFHSWTGDWQTAQKALSLGFYISFSGIVTYKQSLQSSSLNKFGTAGLKNAQEIQEVAKKTPLDRILIETDSPYLSPEPFRGAKNEPKNVRIVAQFLADLRNLPFDEIAEATSQNARQLFGI